MNLHKIQIQILSKVISSNGLKYSECIPENVESDLFNYHLQQLIKHKIISKRNEKYYLSSKGKHLIEEITPINRNGDKTDLFKIAALGIVIKKEDNEIFVLYQIRKRQPMFGIRQIPGGPLLKGELAEQTASRKIKEETGIKADFKLIGIIRKIRYLNSKNIFSDIVYHICLNENSNGSLIESSDYGQNYWLDIDEAIKFEEDTSNGSRNLADIFRKIKNKDLITFFYFVEKYKLKKY